MSDGVEVVRMRVDGRTGPELGKTMVGAEVGRDGMVVVVVVGTAMMSEREREREREREGEREHLI